MDKLSLNQCKDSV